MSAFAEELNGGGQMMEVGKIEQLSSIDRGSDHVDIKRLYCRVMELDRALTDMADSLDGVTRKRIETIERRLDAQGHILSGERFQGLDMKDCGAIPEEIPEPHCCNIMSEHVDAKSIVMVGRSGGYAIQTKGGDWVEFQYCPFCQEEL